MKTTIKDLLIHKFPMDEVEQAMLLHEICNMNKELREWLDMLAEFENHYDAVRKAVLKQVLGVKV